MKSHIKSVFCILLAVFMLAGLQLTARNANALPAGTKVLTAGTASGSYNSTVSVLLSVDDPTGIGGAAFTIKYNPAVFNFVGLELANKTISDGTNCLVQGSDPPDYSNCSAQDIANTMFYQVNDVADPNNAQAKIGQVLVAAASAQSLTNANLFKAKFAIKGGSGVYPIQLVRSVIQNAAAGYAVPTTIPVFVGMPADTPNAQGFYDTPVYATTLVGGAITVNAPGYTISGNVTYDGANADGALVILQQQFGTSYQFLAQTTVQSGAYSFSNRPNGTYRVVVTPNNPAYFMASANVTVSDANASQDFTLQTATRHSGTVTVNGSPLSGIRVKVLDANSNVIGVFPADSSGYFETAPLPPGTYTFIAVVGKEEHQIIEGQTNDWTLTLRSISGTLTGLPGDGSGQVMVTASSVTAKMTRNVKVADLTGTTYTIPNFLDVNDVVVSAVTAGKPVQYYNNVTDVTQATMVDVSAADASNIDFDFALGDTASISGVIEKDGTPVADGKAVYGFNIDTFALTAAFTGNGDGSYTLDVAPGTYEIFVIANNRTFYYNATATTQLASEATAVTVIANDAVPDINIDLTQCNFAIKGSVTFANGGVPLANAFVSAMGSMGQASAFTGSDGKYTIDGLCAGSYIVDMNPLMSGYAHQQQNVAIATANATANFTIDSGYTLSGTVMDSGANGIAGALLYLSDADTGQLVGGRMYLSDNTGAYFIKDVPDGLYTLHVSHPEYKAKDITDLYIGADTTQDVELTQDAYIHGTVDDGANGLRGAMVVATTTGQAAVYTLTKSDGSYAIYGLDSSKTYVVMAMKEGYQRSINNSVVSPATTGTQIDFTLNAIVLTFNLQGTVLDCSNNPIVGAQVVASFDQGADPNNVHKYFFKAAITDANGQYAFTDLPQDANYQLVVIPGGNLRPVMDTGIDGTGGGTVTHDVTFVCGDSISGTVTLSDAGSATIYVVLFDNSDNYVDYQAISGGGQYSFENLVAGNYKVLATATGYTSSSADNVAAGTTGVDITLTAQ